MLDHVRTSIFERLMAFLETAGQLDDHAGS
jgi:hypothetical protein